MPPMLYVLIFLAVVLAVQGLASLASERRSGTRATARKRLRQIALGIQNPDVQSEDSILRARREVQKRLIDLTRLVPFGADLERRLYQAGLTITPARFTTAVRRDRPRRVGRRRRSCSTTRAPRSRSCSRASLPFVQIARLRAQRMHKFEEQFPEALDLITRAMRAGHSLTFGFQMVGDEMPDPIGAEFAQVAEEIKLGRELRVALAQPRLPRRGGRSAVLRHGDHDPARDGRQPRRGAGEARHADPRPLRALRQGPRAHRDREGVREPARVDAADAGPPALHLRRRGRPILRAAAIHHAGRG